MSGYINLLYYGIMVHRYDGCPGKIENIIPMLYVPHLYNMFCGYRYTTGYNHHNINI